MSEEDFVGTRLRIGRWLPAHETTGRCAAAGLLREPVQNGSAVVGPAVPSPPPTEVRNAGSGEWSRRRWTLVAAAVSLAAMLLMGAAVGQWTDRAPTTGRGAGPGAQPGGQADVTSPAPEASASSSGASRPDPVGHVAESPRGTTGMGNHETRVTPPPLTAGARIGLEPVSHPGFRVRHRNFVGRIDRIGPDSSRLDKADASFIVRTGLADRRCFTFEAVNFPGFFLRHQNFLIRLHRFDPSALYAQDTTFCAVTGLAGGHVSFRSVNYPYRFLSVRSDQLHVDPPGPNSATRAAMTFAIHPVLSR